MGATIGNHPPTLQNRFWKSAGVLLCEAHDRAKRLIACRRRRQAPQLNAATGRLRPQRAVAPLGQQLLAKGMRGFNEHLPAQEAASFIKRAPGVRRRRGARQIHALEMGAAVAQQV